MSDNCRVSIGLFFLQGVSDIVHGGDLVTTVCHSTPFTVDTSPPHLNSVDQVLFDEDFRFLVVYFSASDSISGIKSMELGLGRTKYDVELRRYMPLEIRGTSGNTYLVEEEFETASGSPAWIRLKLTNNGGSMDKGIQKSLSLTRNMTCPVHCA